MSERETVVRLPFAAECCPCVDKLRTVLPFAVGIRDGVVHSVSTLGSAVISHGLGVGTGLRAPLRAGPSDRGTRSSVGECSTRVRSVRHRGSGDPRGAGCLRANGAALRGRAAQVGDMRAPASAPLAYSGEEVANIGQGLARGDAKLP